MRYQIWDKKSNVITPRGEVLTAEQWIERFPMAGVEGIKIVIGGGVINGSVCMEFTGMVESYRKMGCDFSECVEDQDYLNVIEAHEDTQNSASQAAISDQTRIADALEDMVVMQELNAMYSE